MATGCYVLVRNQPELIDYVGEAGDAYGDIDEAVRLLRATQGWSAREWRERRLRSIDRGFMRHADMQVLRPIYQDWCELANPRDG